MTLQKSLSSAGDKTNNRTAYISNTLWTVIAGSLYRNVLVFVKVDASVTTSKQLAVKVTSYTML